jgi:hypothetical protein
MTLDVLRRFVKKRTTGPEERCDFCDAEIRPEHGHAIDVQTRHILCVCRACYLLFTQDGAALGRYRSVPDRFLSLEPPAISDRQWAALQIPVGMAFFFKHSALGRTVAFYPGPAGATESELPLDVWREIADASPLVEALEPDVEALLVRRGRSVESYVVPIDTCYELVGRMRRNWKGFDGGDEARQELGRFFDALRARSVRSRPEGVAP